MESEDKADQTIPYKWAIFVRIRVNGVLQPWRFEGFQEDYERIHQIAQTVNEENGEGSFFTVNLPD